MWTATETEDLTKAELYPQLLAQLRALIADEPDAVANMANCAALLFQQVTRLNWAGFYLLKDEQLVLGPFQGAPACVRIPLGRGVCGTAARDRAVLRVPNVHEFDGHIACDSASNSEIALPLLRGDGSLAGVLDLDSPEFDRFDAADEAGLVPIASAIAAKL
ncbi:GAF domain-containing protein [soil metagenome]